ncbi:MAG TPA: sulfatase-like hydrolase/transferase, partial [Vicinamibacteria bacterium]|nr:sulfatase-like hydrolase/transferase [Vicinamibacteria bacterium]
MKRLALAAFFLLYWNALFTFENVPSTPSMRLAPKLSLEVFALLLVLAAVRTLGRPLSRGARAALSLVLLLVTIVRYVDVTAYGVLGREFDLYGDFPHLHRVVAMFFEVMTPSLGFLVASAVLLAAILAFALNWAGLGALDRALANVAWARALAVASAIVLLGYVVLPAKAFAQPVSAIVARQWGHFREGASKTPALATLDVPEKPLRSDLSRLEGANVFLIFVESYGVTLFEDARHFEPLAPRLHELESHLRSAGYFFSSSQIRSSTFGGGSWRAHATLLSGVDTGSEQRYDALLRSRRKTLVHVLKEKGYRTVAAEPGIKWYWPDGRFYGFDRIYDFDALDYRGPPMGWWKIPDQFTLYRLYEEEIARAQKPLFVKASLIMTHIPYFPVPSYVDDWTRFEDGTAYDAGLQSVAHDAYRDLMELSTWYVAAVRYELDVLEGFLTSYVP